MPLSTPTPVSVKTSLSVGDESAGKRLRKFGSASVERSSAPRLVDADVPEAGFYRMRLRRGAVPVGVHIFYGQRNDPETGAPMDRWGWQATINGEPVEMERVWPMCAHGPVEEAEHDYLAGLQEWGRQHDPNGAHANPTRRVDLLRAPLPF